MLRLLLVIIISMLCAASYALPPVIPSVDSLKPKQRPVKQELRDPTAPPQANAKVVFQPKVNNQYQLEMIIYSKGQQLALINGQYVKVGDRIGNSQVMAIHNNSVTLSTPLGKKVLQLVVDYKIRSNGS